MQATRVITNGKTWISESFSKKSRAKFLGGLALGAMLTAAVAVPLAVTHSTPDQSVSYSRFYPATEEIGAVSIQNYAQDTHSTGQFIPFGPDVAEVVEVAEFPPLNPALLKQETVSRSIPPSEAYEAFAAWEFLGMIPTVLEQQTVSRSIQPSEAYETFAAWEFPDMIPTVLEQQTVNPAAYGPLGDYMGLEATNPPGAIDYSIMDWVVSLTAEFPPLNPALLEQYMDIPGMR